MIQRKAVCSGIRIAGSSFWRQRATWIGAAAYAALVLYVFRALLLAEETGLASLGGDSVKNTFTFLYQALYGQGVWFTGMNYPFGEHLSFADAQPLMTIPLGAIGHLFHLSPPQLLYTMYVAVAISFVVGMLYTQRTLQYNGVPAGWAILFAGLILLLSPHVSRFLGHYPLAYASFLPMLFYWSLRYYDTNQNSYLWKLLLLFLAYALLHLYFIAMGLIWSAAYAAGALLYRRGHSGRPIWHGLRYLLPAAGAFMSVQLLFRLTDPVRDRPVLPYSEFYNDHGFLELLLSNNSPIWQAVQEHGLFHYKPGPSEHFMYLGVVPVLMLLLYGILSATRYMARLGHTGRAFSFQWLFIAFSILLFATTVKFVWNDGVLQGLLQPLRQFRAPERFSWIAWYVFSVLAAVLIYRLSCYWWQQGARFGSLLFGVVMTCLWAIDANGAILFFQNQNAGTSWNGRYFFSRETSWKNHLAARGYQPQNFQAILALPFVHVGSEKIWLNENQSYCTTPAFKAALELKLPVMDVNMSRTSWQQTFEAMRLAGGLYARQDLLRRLLPGKPVLLFHFLPDVLTPDEAMLLQPGVADSLGTIDECRLFVFWPEKFLARQAAEWQQLKTIAAPLAPGDTLLGSDLPYFAAHLDEALDKPGIAGSGMAPLPQESALLATWTLPERQDSAVLYEFSAWSQLPVVGPRSNYIQLQCLDSAGALLLSVDALGKYSTDNQPDMWFRLSKYFELPARTHRIALVVHNPGGESYLALDELLLRPAKGTLLSKRKGGTLLVNNHVISR